MKRERDRWTERQMRGILERETERGGERMKERERERERKREKERERERRREREISTNLLRFYTVNHH